jgi:hypothetical protein
VYSTSASQVVHVSSNANLLAKAFLNGNLGNSQKGMTPMKSKKSIAATKHGMSNTRPYNIWRGMKSRCDNPDKRLVRWYNEISYEPRWADFQEFWNDMREGYADGLTLDRIDSTKNYCADNCRWVDMKAQSRNRRDNVMIPYQGEMICASDYADRVGLPRSLIYKRVEAGVPFDMLALPSRKRATAVKAQIKELQQCK